MNTAKAQCTEVTRKGTQCSRSATWAVVRTGAQVCKVHALELGCYGLEVRDNKET